MESGKPETCRRPGVRPGHRSRLAFGAKVLAAAVLTAVFPTAAGAAIRAAVPPNIVVILADDLGYGDLAAYGAEDMRTPNIDGIAADGIRFDRFYANSNVCSPTRAALLSGRFPDRAGVPGVIREHAPANNWGYFNTGLVTLPQALKRGGYHTALVGKWHLGTASPNLPNDRGFDHFHGFIGDMMDDYLDHRRAGRNYMRLNRQAIDPAGHATDLFTRWAIEYIQGRKGSAQPFFLYLAHFAPHVPVQPPQAWLDRVLARQPGISPARARLVALIEHMDDGVGKVLSALRDNGMAGNTLVVFTSDNGGQVSVGASNGGLNGTKGTMLEGGLRVPFAASWPGRIRTGSRSRRMALTMDLFPTLCEAAGVSCTHEMDGRSLLPAWMGLPQPEENRALFWVNRTAEGAAAGQGAAYAARSGDFKLVKDGPEAGYRLYDLRSDPLEADPLAEGHPAFAPLLAALRKHQDEADRVGWRPGSPAVSPRSLSLVSPPSEASWTPGGVARIAWTSEGGVGPVSLHYSLDGYSWAEIPGAQGLLDSGSHVWTVPRAPASGMLRIRAEALGGDVADIRSVSLAPSPASPFIRRYPASDRPKAVAGPGGGIFRAGMLYRLDGRGRVTESVETHCVRSAR